MESILRISGSIVHFPSEYCKFGNFRENFIFANRVNSPVENQNDLELDFKVFFFVDSIC